MKPIWGYRDGLRSNLRKIQDLGLGFRRIVAQSIEASFDAINLNCLGVYGGNLVGNRIVSSISVDCDGWRVNLGSRFRAFGGKSNDRASNWGFKVPVAAGCGGRLVVVRWSWEVEGWCRR